MSNHGESSNVSPRPLEQVRVALIGPEKNILISPDSHSGLFAGERKERQSVEKAAHGIVGRHIGTTALSTVIALRHHTNTDTGLITYGHVLRSSYGSLFDPEERGLNIVRLDDHHPVDDIEKFFLSQLA